MASKAVVWRSAKTGGACLPASPSRWAYVLIVYYSSEIQHWHINWQGGQSSARRLFANEIVLIRQGGEHGATRPIGPKVVKNCYM